MIKKIDDIIRKRLLCFFWVAVWMIKKIDDIDRYLGWTCFVVAVWMIKKIDDIFLLQPSQDFESCSLND